MDLHAQEQMAIMAAMENAKAEAEAQVRADPTNAQAHLQWGAALLELAQLKTADEAKNLVTEAVAKLRRCLELKPSEHKAMWCLGQCHHALGFMTEDREEAEELFATMTQEFRRAVELEPGNPVYQHSVEQARQTLDMWEQIHEQLQHQQRLQDVGEIRPARGAGRKATSSKNAFWGISEDTWVEGIAWVATGVLAVGLIYMLNRAAPPPPPPKA